MIAVIQIDAFRFFRIRNGVNISFRRRKVGDHAATGGLVSIRATTPEALCGCFENHSSGRRIRCDRRRSGYVFDDAVFNEVTLDVAIPDALLFRIEQCQIDLRSRLQGCVVKARGKSCKPLVAT